MQAFHVGRIFKNLNDKSIGIEIQNSGHSGKYESFSNKQIKSLSFLSKVLKKKYHIQSKKFFRTF